MTPREHANSAHAEWGGIRTPSPVRFGVHPFTGLPALCSLISFPNTKTQQCVPRMLVQNKWITEVFTGDSLQGHLTVPLNASYRFWFHFHSLFSMEWKTDYMDNNFHKRPHLLLFSTQTQNRSRSAWLTLWKNPQCAHGPLSCTRANYTCWDGCSSDEFKLC